MIYRVSRLEADIGVVFHRGRIADRFTSVAWSKILTANGMQATPKVSHIERNWRRWHTPLVATLCMKRRTSIRRFYGKKTEQRREAKAQA